MQLFSPQGRYCGATGLTSPCFAPTARALSVLFRRPTAACAVTEEPVHGFNKDSWGKPPEHTRRNRERHRHRTLARLGSPYLPPCGFTGMARPRHHQPPETPGPAQGMKAIDPRLIQAAKAG
jgi:hypothetical protein